MPLFRQEVIEAQRHRLSGTVVAAVPPSSRLYTLLILGVVVVAMLLIGFGSYASSASVRGEVVYSQGAARLYPRSPGEVRRIFASVGDQVRSGQPLVELALAPGSRGLANQIGELDKQIAEVDRQLSLATAVTSTEAAGLATQRSGLAAAAASVQRQRAIAVAQVRLAELAVGRSQRLAAEEAGTQRQVEDARAALLARRADAESLGERLITLRNNMAELGTRLSQGGLESSRTRSQLLAQRSALQTQKSDLQRSDRMTLTAPVDGQIADLPASLGRRVTPDQSLATVVPRGSGQEVWLYAPSRAIGFARSGQTVRLRFDAFPYQRYGSGRGTVIDVSRVAVDPATVDASFDLKEPLFRVRVRMQPTGIATREDALIRPGMVVTGDLVLARRPLWALLLGPLRESASR